MHELGLQTVQTKDASLANWVSKRKEAIEMLFAGAWGDEPFSHALCVAFLAGGIQLVGLLRLGCGVLCVLHAVVHCEIGRWG